MEGIFLGVMEIHEAKNHQLKLRERGVVVEFRTNGHTCTTGCKVTVEVWGKDEDKDKLADYFQRDFLKHIRGHEPDFENLSQVFDPSLEIVVCQACGSNFSPAMKECPDCGLFYG